MSKNTSGFTIVELLIVIVVIAILAAIGIATYSGIQQRATNTAIINAASQIAKAIEVYVAQEGVYPSASYVCITAQSGCVETGGAARSANATFDANMATVGTLPRSVPTVGAVGNGIIYNYNAGRVVNGESKPAILMYFLNGPRRACGLSGVLDNWGVAPGGATIRSEPKYTAWNAETDKTICYISISGPGV